MASWTPSFKVERLPKWVFSGVFLFWYLLVYVTLKHGALIILVQLPHFSNQGWSRLLGCPGFPLTLAKAVRHFPVLPFPDFVCYSSLTLDWEENLKVNRDLMTAVAGRTRQAEETRRGHSSVCQSPAGVPGALPGGGGEGSGEFMGED